ncbi:hypothetical protein BOX37_13140 [Nocardia mangyaensis]|uniref:Transposase IS701-like DDE domain-containing protein n=1 Tax=Nocardia mangyaensis TaxID=2213200 RepID=A0A1J0W1Z8_9NOCA|nr:hypothetical protein BOX37_13140 [Nocardia mangyaensis]
MALVGEQLDSSVGEVFSSLARKDRVATAGLYVRGVMRDGKRKPVQPMAQRLQTDHQRLQQFVTSSPWDMVPVRKVLSHKACEVIVPQAWAIDDTGFAKADPGRRVWPASTRALWARSAIARSPSACTRSPTTRRHL